MTNHCAANAADPANRNAWGVDLNRNFSVGAVSDGYNGASSTCTSDTYAGPSKLSEPEARNEVWLTNQYPNIKFADQHALLRRLLHVASGGLQDRWARGAAAGRLGTENYFWSASDHILSAVQTYRGTAIWPGRTGHRHRRALLGGRQQRRRALVQPGHHRLGLRGRRGPLHPETKRFTAVGFQPAFSEGHEEAMEFANGQIAILGGRPRLRRRPEAPRVEAEDHQSDRHLHHVHLRCRRTRQRVLHAGRKAADVRLAQAAGGGHASREPSRSRSTRPPRCPGSPSTSPATSRRTTSRTATARTTTRRP